MPGFLFDLKHRFAHRSETAPPVSFPAEDTNANIQILREARHLQGQALPKLSEAASAEEQPEVHHQHHSPATHESRNMSHFFDRKTHTVTGRSLALQAEQARRAGFPPFHQMPPKRPPTLAQKIKRAFLAQAYGGKPNVE